MIVGKIGCRFPMILDEGRSNAVGLRVSARLTTTPEKKNGAARQNANSAQATEC